MGIWDFIQDEILGMKWLNRLIGSVLNACGLDTSRKIGGSVQFFIYDVIKIMVLLSVLIFLISYIQSYFPPERTKKILGRFHGIGANCIAALLGTVTPFCSCSSIPLFMGFTSAGLPLGVTFSFLISSPMVDLGSLILLMSIFGWKVAVVYVIVGLVIAVAGGTLIEKLHLESEVEEFIRNGKSIDTPQNELTKRDRLKYSWEQVTGTVKKVFPYVIVGVGIGAVIHNWIPEEWVIKLLGTGNPFGVIIATICGIPMYADIFGCIPIAEALVAKGAKLGVVLAFMMGVITLSLPSMIMLKKAIKPKLLGIFIAICTVGIILVGYFFNIIQNYIIYDDYICTDNFGNLITPVYVTDHFASMIRKHRLKKLRFHDLRHSCASLLLANGVPMKAIQEWLGHSTFQVTADFYSHLEFNSKLSSADAIAQALGACNPDAEEANSKADNSKPTSNDENA